MRAGFPFKTEIETILFVISGGGIDVTMQHLTHGKNHCFILSITRETGNESLLTNASPMLQLEKIQ